MTDHSQQHGHDPFSVTDSTIISRSPNVLTAEVGGEILMVNDRGTYFSLNEVGGDIWRRLDEPCSFAELIDQLSAEYQATKETIAGDVRRWLGRMVAEDIVRLA